MFVQNRSLNKVDARPSEIATLLVSTNRPLVALAGPAQQADAFIVSVNRGKTQPVYLCFHIIKEGQRLIYTSNAVPTSQSARVKLEGEAVRFAEDMGFMMVQERFEGLSPEERENAFMGLAPFVDDISQVRKEEKRAKKQKRDETAKAAESEVEYEEVYEEVEEEVPVDDEPLRPEEYESLSDVVDEISTQEASTAARDAEEAERHEPDNGSPADEEAFDLGQELSDVVETIRELPETPRPESPPSVEMPTPTESSTPIERPKSTEPSPPVERPAPTQAQSFAEMPTPTESHSFTERPVPTGAPPSTEKSAPTEPPPPAERPTPPQDAGKVQKERESQIPPAQKVVSEREKAIVELLIIL